jgi:hypothetical protein
LIKKAKAIPMLTDRISKILNELNGLLADDLSPHSISLQFQKMTELLSNENLSLQLMNCREYYDDGDLSLVLLMKNEALANAQFELASKFGILEKELLEEKGDNEFTRLKTEPFFFEFRNNSIIFHFNKKQQNQRLIANMIEGHNLLHQRSPMPKALSY